MIWCEYLPCKCCYSLVVHSAIHQLNFLCFAPSIFYFSGSKKSKRLNERERALGRITAVKEDGTFDIEWILEGGKLHVEREDLLWTSAEAEGMTANSTTRKRRKPAEYQMETELKDQAKKVKRQQAKTKAAPKAVPKKTKTSSQSVKKNAASATVARSKPTTKLGSKPIAKKAKVEPVKEPPPKIPLGSDVYDKHYRELERCFKRLSGLKVDTYEHFWCDDDTDSSPSASSVRDWDSIRRHMESGRYKLDRKIQDQKEWQSLFPDCDSPVMKKRKAIQLACPFGVNWELFRDDVVAMVDETVQTSDDPGDGERGSLVYAARAVKEAVEQTVERSARKHAKEMMYIDDRLRFGGAVEKGTNTEAAMQSWRKDPFPERKYERLTADTICAGLSTLDKRIAEYERRTQLPDSFIGLSYRYDDTHQSETWMQSVVDETGSGGKQKTNEKQAALALSADEGVRRAQINATMQSLLIAVQDKVMTERKVLQERELNSANWLLDESDRSSSDPEPEIVEQPVWGIDCYTRKNILLCLETEFDDHIALLFVEKWLLPAINACPMSLAHKLSSAALILEGLPPEEENDQTGWSQTVLGRALEEKIKKSAPPWLKAAANRLRRAIRALGVDFFRVHPKGHGSVVLCNQLPPNTLVTYYRGELYPSWRWGEKMDAISITQKRTKLKP